MRAGMRNKEFCLRGLIETLWHYQEKKSSSGAAKVLRGMYITHIYNFDVNMLVWLDETGTDKRDQLRKYGYALRGDTPHYHRLLSRGQRTNAIACMCIEGIVALELVNGTV